MANGLVIRLATPEDAQAVHGIYADYVLHSVATFEIEPPTVEQMRDRIGRVLERYPYLVAEREGRVIAFAYASAFRSRPAYDWSAETTIYAAPDAIGTGVSGMLYSRLEELLAGMGIRTMYACIADPNPASERFHEKCGYVKAGSFTNCGFKHGTWLGITWWEKHIGTFMGQTEPVSFRSWLDAGSGME